MGRLERLVISALITHLELHDLAAATGAAALAASSAASAASSAASAGGAAGGAAAGEAVELPASLTAVWEAARKVTRWVREQLRQARQRDAGTARRLARFSGGASPAEPSGRFPGGGGSGVGDDGEEQEHEEGATGSDDDDDDDDDGGVDFERKARQTVARLARQAKESDMEMQTQQDQGFAMPSIEELAAEGEMPADITMLTARVKGTVRPK